MSHYLCTECKTVSQHPGTCQMEDCIQRGMSLVECRCEDGLHTSVVQDEQASPETQEEGDSGAEKPLTTIDLDSE